MSAKPAKITRVSGSKEQLPFTEHPERLQYGEMDSRPISLMSEAKLSDVFTPFYDRPDFLLDNASRRANNKSWRIPEGQGVTRREK